MTLPVLLGLGSVRARGKWHERVSVLVGVIAAVASFHRHGAMAGALCLRPKRWLESAVEPEPRVGPRQLALVAAIGSWAGFGVPVVLIGGEAVPLALTLF